MKITSLVLRLKCYFRHNKSVHNGYMQFKRHVCAECVCKSDETESRALWQPIHIIPCLGAHADARSTKPVRERITHVTLNFLNDLFSCHVSQTMHRDTHACLKTLIHFQVSYYRELKWAASFSEMGNKFQYDQFFSVNVGFCVCWPCEEWVICLTSSISPWNK